MSSLIASLILLACLAIPAILSLYNFIGLFRDYKNRTLKYTIWILTPLLGTAMTGLFMEVLDVQLDMVWTEQLYNSQLHQPVWTGSWLTLGLICLIGALGAAVLTVCDVKKTPPLVSVLCMAAMYLLLAVQLFWCLQMMNHMENMAPSPSSGRR